MPATKKASAKSAPSKSTSPKNSLSKEASAKTPRSQRATAPSKAGLSVKAPTPETTVKKPSKPRIDGVELAQRKDLRAWLKLHASSSKGTQIITPSRESGLPRLTADDLLEELLCFGWVDGEPVRLDDQNVRIPCAPRKPKEPWTRTQKEKIKKLTTLRMMTPAGQSMVDLAKRTGTWDAPESPDDLKVPLDLRSALSGTSNAREHWESFDRATRREIVEWILASKTIEIRERRVQETVAKAAKNQAVTLKP